MARFARLRTHGGPGELTGYARSLWATLSEPRQVLQDAVREQYQRLFAALSVPSYLTPGNVDLPHLWPEFLRPGVHMLDGEVAGIGGPRFGFVGGLPLPPWIESISGGPWWPYVRSRAEYDAACAGGWVPSTCCAATCRLGCLSWPTTWSPAGPR